jgi:hypothetical protein
LTIGLIIAGAAIICAIVGIFLFRKCTVAPSSGFKNRLKSNATAMEATPPPAAPAVNPQYATYESTEYVYNQAPVQQAQAQQYAVYEQYEQTPYQRYPQQQQQNGYQEGYYQEEYNQYYDPQSGYYYQNQDPSQVGQSQVGQSQAYYYPDPSQTVPPPPVPKQ